jgi:glutathione S-transferase
MRILHAALPDDWAAAAENGSYDVSTRGVTVVEADFIHCSTLDQLPGVLDRYYADVPAVDVLVLDLDRLDHEGATVRWEPAEGGLYPHVYGVVPAVAVVEAVRVEHVPGQAWSVPDLSSYDVATGP